MRWPMLHAVSPLATTPMAEILNAPPIQVIPAVDDLGIQYGSDLQLTQGLYLLCVSAVLLNWTRRLVVDWVKRNRSDS